VHRLERENTLYVVDPDLLGGASMSRKNYWKNTCTCRCTFDHGMRRTQDKPKPSNPNSGNKMERPGLGTP